MEHSITDKMHHGPPPGPANTPVAPVEYDFGPNGTTMRVLVPYGAIMERGHFGYRG